MAEGYDNVIPLFRPEVLPEPLTPADKLRGLLVDARDKVPRSSFFAVDGFDERLAAILAEVGPGARIRVRPIEAKLQASVVGERCENGRILASSAKPEIVDAMIEEGFANLNPRPRFSGLLICTLGSRQEGKTRLGTVQVGIKWEDIDFDSIEVFVPEPTDDATDLVGSSPVGTA